MKHTVETVDDLLKLLFEGKKNFPTLNFNVELPNGQTYYGTSYVFQYHQDFGPEEYGPNVKEFRILSEAGQVILALLPDENISGFLNHVELENGTYVTFWKLEPAF